MKRHDAVQTHCCFGVKVIEAKQADCIRSPAFGAPFVPREAALCLDLDHPNVMTTYKLITENLPGEPHTPGCNGYLSPPPSPPGHTAQFQASRKSTGGGWAGATPAVRIITISDCDTMQKLRWALLSRVDSGFCATVPGEVSWALLALSVVGKGRGGGGGGPK